MNSAEAWPRNHHFLKCVQPYFDAVWNQTKTFEIRLNDRNFQEGDFVTLQEWDSQKGHMGRQVFAQIGFLTDFQQRPGYVVFSITRWIGPPSPATDQEEVNE